MAKVTKLHVARWIHFGLDRLYVKDRTGEPIGYRDNETGICTVRNESNRPVFDQAIAEYLLAHPDLTPEMPSPAEPDAQTA